MNDATTKPRHLADESDLDSFLAEHETVLVEFYTEGCGICASMEPVLGIVARETEAAVALVNPRDDPALVERFDVRSVPTLVRFEAGTETARVADGFRGVDEVLAFLEASPPSGTD